MIEINKYVIKKEELDKLEESEVTLFFKVGHIANEINSLNKFFYWTSKSTNKEKPEVYGNLVNQTLILRLLVGKINEANEYLKTFYANPKTGKIYIKQFSEEALILKKEIDKFFNDNTFFNRVRNDLSFHYKEGSYKDITTDYDELALYLSNSPINNLYYHSEILHFNKLLNLMGVESINNLDLFEQKLLTVLSKVNSIVSKLLRYFDEIILVFVDRNPQIISTEEKKYKLFPKNKFKQFEIPYFTIIE